MNPWDQHSVELAETVRRATNELFLSVAKNPTMSVPEFHKLCDRLVNKWGRVAVGSAVQALDSSRRALEQWDALPPPVPADPVPAAQVRGSVAWALSRSSDVVTASRLFAGPLGRLVQQGARETVYKSTQAAKTRYARIPGPKACAFCLMLASRGAVYTADTVLTTRGTRDTRARKARPGQTHARNPNADSGHTFRSGSRPEGMKYHDHCDCRAQESITDADLPQIVHDLQQEWYEVTDSSMGPEEMRKAWNAHIAQTRPNNTSYHPTRYTRSEHWVPADAIRIERKVALRQSVIDGTDTRKIPPSAEALERDGLVLPPGEFPEPKSKSERAVQEKEQLIIDWLHANGAENISKVLRYDDLPGAKDKELKTPDLVVDGVPTEAKTLTSVKKIAHRLGDASEQARTVVYDVRGVDTDKNTVIAKADDAIRHYGDRIDRLVIIGKDFTITWP